MNLQVGFDLVEINRIEKSLKNPRFRKRIYSEKELSFYPKKVESLAANFAAKEAFAKALGTGFRGFSFRDISVLRSENGKPVILLSQKLQRIIGKKKYSLSLTHTRSTAGAFVTIYTEK